MMDQSCLFCDIPVQVDFLSFDKHLQYGHGIVKRRELAMSILLLLGNSTEADGIMTKGRHVYNQFKSAGAMKQETQVKEEDVVDVTVKHFPAQGAPRR